MTSMKCLDKSWRSCLHLFVTPTFPSTLSDDLKRPMELVGEIELIVVWGCTQSLVLTIDLHHPSSYDLHMISLSFPYHFLINYWSSTSLTARLFNDRATQ